MGDKIFEGSGRGTTLPEGTLPGVRSVKLATQPSIDGGVGFGNEGMNVARLQLKVRELERLLRDTQVRGEGGSFAHDLFLCVVVVVVLDT